MFGRIMVEVFKDREKVFFKVDDLRIKIFLKFIDFNKLEI